MQRWGVFSSLDANCALIYFRWLYVCCRGGGNKEDSSSPHGINTGSAAQCVCYVYTSVFFSKFTCNTLSVFSSTPPTCSFGNREECLLLPFLLFQDRALSADGRRDFTRDFAKRMSEGGSKSGGGGGGRPTAQFFRRRLWMDPFLRLLTFSNGFLGVARSFDEKR